MRLRLIILVLALEASAWGQGSVSTGTPITFDQNGHILQNAQVAFCTKYPGVATNPPCGEAGNALATIYTDITLGTACSGSAGSPLNNVGSPSVGAGCSNPGTPSNGNVVAYTQPGLYWVEYYGFGIVTQASPVIFPASLTPPVVIGTGAPNTSITPLTFSSQNGTSSVFLTGSTATAPYNNFSCWEGTIMFTAGIVPMCVRFDAMTKLGVDVQAGTTVGIFKSVRSTNSGGTANDNSTNQDALVVNSSGNDATASANEIGIDTAAQSGFTGAGTHTTEALQASVSSGRAPGWFGDATHDYTIVQANILKASATQDGTVALGIDSSTVGKGFLAGAYIASVRNFGLGFLNGQAVPSAALWAAQAVNYGLFCGAGITNIPWSSNPVNVPIFANNPANCIAAGPSALSSGTSSNIRWISTSAGGAEQDWDSLHSPDGILHFKFAGADKFTFDNNGNGVLTGASTATKFCMTANLCWTSGAGVPSAGSCTAANGGSLYSRTDGNTTTTLYVCDNATHAWTPK